ncbi:hypothetical protein [Brevibacterium linens]|uniref:Uncharacterized protein n=1 Tax=Brevibacterium linens TaxID=1703 RepID=A0A2H1KHB7_BRELN|nr:hypothetical protein [Brevibacterium linens]SMX99151.1 hypothetical protein BLIN101_03356 [Brevibacterium linens]
MTVPTTDPMLRIVYGAAYDHLLRHPEFDGRPRPGHPALIRTGVDPADVQSWPGVEDVRRMTRDEWIEARLEAVRRGDEEPPLRPKERP